jgi:hypothetical protein
MSEITVREGTIADLDALEPLWQAVHRHGARASAPACRAPSKTACAIRASTT